MLKRADNASLLHRERTRRRVDLILQIGKTHHTFARKVQRADLERWQLRQKQVPLAVMVPEKGRTYWNFVDKWWWDNDGLVADQVHALLVTQLRRQQARIERAQAMVAMAAEPRPAARGQIPDELKQYVWTRDGGACRGCGATVELQFDHIIPISFGGATVADNLQVLCGPCNRRKGAGLTTQ